MLSEFDIKIVIWLGSAVFGIGCVVTLLGLLMVIGAFLKH